MSTRSKGHRSSTVSGGEKASGAEHAKEVLRTYLKGIHEATRRYFYWLSAEESVPGSLSYLLGISEDDLLEVFKICGFYSINKSVFLITAFSDWVSISFASKTVEVTTFQRRSFIKIGRGKFPERPASQLEEALEPSKFRILSTTEGQSSKESLMQLFNSPPTTEATATTPTVTTTTPTTTPTSDVARITTSPAASPLKVPHSPVKLTQKFNITTPDKVETTTANVVTVAASETETSQSQRRT
jgi:hypothetical protein